MKMESVLISRGTNIGRVVANHFTSSPLNRQLRFNKGNSAPLSHPRHLLPRVLHPTALIPFFDLTTAFNLPPIFLFFPIYLRMFFFSINNIPILFKIFLNFSSNIFFIKTLKMIADTSNTNL